MAVNLITGANGFSGRHLIGLLEDDNDSNIVYGISRRILQFFGHIPTRK